VADNQQPPPVPSSAITSEVPGASLSASGAVELQAVKSAWGRILEGVMQEQRSLGSFLQEGQPGSVEGSVLRILFEETGRFNMSQVEKNRTVVEEVCQQVLGARLRVQCAVGASTADDGQAAGKVKAAPAKDDAQVDPTVKSVLDTFDGELV
jgi:hypothetical protein